MVLTNLRKQTKTKNAKMKRTGWQVDDLNKLNPKAERLIWEQKCARSYELANKKMEAKPPLLVKG